MKIALLMVLTFLSTTSFAKDVIIMIGGGGEPKGAKETQFDSSMEQVGDFYKDNSDKYDATVNFNGGHEKTESKIQKSYKGAQILNNFTAANYNKVIDDTINKLNANQIPAGAKILLFIDSHGSEKSTEATHSISTANSAMANMNSGGAGMVSLDKIKTLSTLAEKKGVRMGIIDGSCHAGNSLSLSNSKTCVIAASGPNHYSYSDFAAIYAKNMKKGKNLEQIFFEATDENAGKGFPMISSPAGMEVQDAIYPYLTPYMYYHDEYRGMALDKIDKYMKKTYSAQLMCEREEQFSKLLAIVKLVEDVSKVNNVIQPVDLGDLKEKLAKYKKTQDEYFKKLSQLDLSTFDKKEVVTTAAYKGSSNSYTHKELLSTNYEFLIKIKGEALLDKNLTDKKRDQARDLVEFYRACQATKERIIRDNPQYKSQEAIIAGLKDDDKVGFSVASEIMKESRKAYNTYYKIRESELLKNRSAAPNPCKDFVL